MIQETPGYHKGSHFSALLGDPSRLADNMQPGSLDPFIFSRSNHCNALYIGLPSKSVWRYQLLKNITVYYQKLSRACVGLPFVSHSIVYWAQFKVSTTTTKTLSGLGLSFLQSHLSPNATSRQLLSSKQALLHVPPCEWRKLTAAHTCTISVVAPVLVSGMPDEVPLSWLFTNFVKFKLPRGAF